MARLVTLCIPTNGIDEVFEVLDSIYGQDVSEDRYEVVVTDNGDSPSFFKKMSEYANRHSNCYYYRTKAVLFANQIECFNRATAPFIKFVNHRMLLLPGSLECFIRFAKDHLSDKPVVYYSNGSVKLDGLREFDSFDGFIEALGYQSSWSGGLSIWKDQYSKLDLSGGVNRFFPHCDILFSQRDASCFFIDNNKYLKALSSDHSKKGAYDLFEAFAVEYPSLILDLYRDGDISGSTLMSVLDKNLSFISSLVFKFVIKRESCSYDLSRFSETIGIYYSRARVYKRICKMVFKQLFNL